MNDENEVSFSVPWVAHAKNFVLGNLLWLVMKTSGLLITLQVNTIGVSRDEEN